MALSMDEQRMLAEIERRLAAEDPGLAARMSTFRLPGWSTSSGLRELALLVRFSPSPSSRWFLSMVYAILPFRSVPGRPAMSR